MSEPIKVFGIEDYQHYFASSSISTEADIETSMQVPVSSGETTEVVPETHTATVYASGLITTDEFNIDLTTMTNLSIGLLVAMGLLIGLNLGKIFLDKIWR